MRLQTPSYLVGLGIQYLPEIFAANLGKAEMYLQIGRFRTQPGNEGQAKKHPTRMVEGQASLGKIIKPTLRGIRKSIRVSLVVLFCRLDRQPESLGAHEISETMMIDFSYRWIGTDR